MTTPKTCPTCGKEFADSKHPNRKFCSHACAMLARRRRGIRICPGCGVEFEQRIPAQKYCTAECGFKHRPRPEVTAKKACTCEWCGSEFWTWNSRPGRFCSSQCRSEFGAHQPKGQRAKMVTVCCEICGKEFVVFASYFKLRGSRFCSLACKRKGASLDKMSAGNPNYIGGTRFPNRGRNWLSQRRAALNRDGGKCCVCGFKPRPTQKRMIDVHHITPYKDFGGDYLKANELTNLITLCRRCHGRVETGKIACPRPLF